MSKEKDSKLHIPLTAFERCEQQMRDALDAMETLMQHKTVADNLERFDVARNFALAADHLRIAKLLLLDGMRRAAAAKSTGEFGEPAA